MLSPKWDIFSTTALQGLEDITEEGAERLRELEGGVKAVKCLMHTRDLTATAAAWISQYSSRQQLLDSEGCRKRT